MGKTTGKVVAAIGAALIAYLIFFQWVYTDEHEERGEPAATAWVHSQMSWIPVPDSWIETLAVKMDQNFLDDKKAKRRLEELKANR